MNLQEGWRDQPVQVIQTEETMPRTYRIAALALATTVAFSAGSGAMAREGGNNLTGHAGSMSNGGSHASPVAAKSVNLGGLSRFVLKNVIKGGKLVAGSLGTLGGAMSGPGKCGKCL